MNTEQILISLLRAEVCGGTVAENMGRELSHEMLSNIYRLSKQHDLAHLVGQALSKLEEGLPQGEITEEFKKQAMKAVYRYVRMNRECEQISKTLEEAQVPFIPLKGAVIRANYPEPWMRTSSDIDILVKRKDLEAAIQALTENLRYEKKGELFYDVSLYSASGIHIELHFDVLEEWRAQKAQKILGKIWDNVTLQKGSNYHYCMSDALFYFYHITHMAKHMQDGGCGIRPFLDLWILNHRIAHDRNEREALLAEGGLLTFARAAEKLSEVWFSDGEADPLSMQFGQYVLSGGVYGTLKNNVAVKQIQQGSKFRYAVSKIFLPYDIIKYYYPILQRHKWLLPAYQIIRWFRLAFCGGARRSLKTLKTNASMSEQERMDTAELLKRLEL